MTIEQFIAAEESTHPVCVDRIDDEQGTIITLHRNLDEDEPAGEHVFLSFSPENALKLAKALRRAALGR